MHNHNHNHTPVTIEVNLPRTLSEDSTNEIIPSGHSHEVEKASTSKAGIVKLNDTLVSLSKVEALTANQGRELAERIEEVLSASEVGAINKTLDAALAILATRYTSAYATHQAARDNVARHPENALIYIVNDPQMSFNGLWTVVGGNLVKAPWDALSSALTSEPFEVLQAIFQGAAGEKITYEGKTYDTLATLAQTHEEGKQYIQDVLIDLAQSNNFTASYLLTASGKFQEEINNETVKFVESIADLMQFPTSTDQPVDVVSYHQGKGLGGGKYQYISTLLKSAHNGGTVIDPALNFPTDWDDQTQLEAWFYPTSQTGYGCWSRISDGGNNIQVFGALPDGVNRVNLLLEKMTDIGISIYAPKGIYRVENFTRQLRGDANLNQKSMRIYGDLTYGSTDQGYSWTESTVFQGSGDMFKSVVNVRLDNLLFRNTPNTTLGKLFTLGDFAQCEWSNCIFGPSNYHIYNPGLGFDGYNVKPSYRNCRFYGAKIYSRYFEGTVANYREENCYTSTNKNGVYFAAPVTASIESCVYEYNEDGAIELDGYGYTGELGLSLKDVFFETNGAGVPYSGVKSKPHIVIRSAKSGGAEPGIDASLINFKQENCYYTDTSSGAKAESCILVDSKTVNIVDVNCWIERAIVSEVDMYSGSLTAKINFETQYADTKSTLTKIGKELSAKIIRQGMNDAVDVSNKGAASITGTNCDLAAPRGMTLAAGAYYDFMLGLKNSLANGVLYVTLGNVNAQYRFTGNTEDAAVTEIFKTGHTAGVNDLTVVRAGYPKLGVRITNTGTSTRFINVGYSGLIYN